VGAMTLLPDKNYPMREDMSVVQVHPNSKAKTLKIPLTSDEFKLLPFQKYLFLNLTFSTYFDRQTSKI